MIAKSWQNCTIYKRYDWCLNPKEIFLFQLEDLLSGAASRWKEKKVKRNPSDTHKEQNTIFYICIKKLFQNMCIFLLLSQNQEVNLQFGLKDQGETTSPACTAQTMELFTYDKKKN